MPPKEGLGSSRLRPTPYPVRRVHALTRWVQSGEYDGIVSGDYIRRGEEPAPSDEVRQAVAHYTERYGELVHRTAGGVTKWSSQVRRWLDSLANHPEEDEGNIYEGA